MKVENIKEVKARFNRIVSDLPFEESVIITKNGRPCAVLMPITKDTDLEILALSQNKRFWKLYDAVFEKAKKVGRLSTTFSASPRRSRDRQCCRGAAAACG